VVRIYPLLRNGPINMHSRQLKTVFSVGSVPRSFLEDSGRHKQLRIEDSAVEF
jgi:hypothetical protein